MIPFRLFFVPDFPTDMVQPRVGRGEPETAGWMERLKADISAAGFRQPLCVYGHQECHGTTQPRWMVKIGFNRLWCAKSLGLPTIPVIVSSRSAKDIPGTPVPIDPHQLQDYFVEGEAWVSEDGFGVVGVRLPQDEFANAT